VRRPPRSAERFWFWWERAGIYAILAVLVLGAAATNRDFRRPLNLANILAQSAPIGVAAVGMTFAIISGVFDLSVGATMGLSACLFVGFAPALGLLPAALFATAAGATLGLINGLIVTRLRVNPFIATLGTMWVFRALAFMYTRNQSLQLNHPLAHSLSGSLLGLPVLFILMLVLYGAAWFVMHRTAFGRYTFALGSNRRAALLSGIGVSSVRVFVFVLAGASAALGGITLALRLGSAKADTATGYELTVIAAVVLGGTSLKGGSGSLAGTLGASLLFAVIYNAMDMYELQSFYQKIALGVVLLLALSIDGVRRRFVS
jgi:ribose transport system permease protein